MSKLPKLEIKDRDGMASLWVDDWNIYDLPHRFITDDVLSAIQRAFELGSKFTVDKMANVLDDAEIRIGHSVDAWSDQRKKRRKP